MNLRFTKAEGLSNDFVMLDCATVRQSDEIQSRAARLCDRRRGIGADGVICVLPASKAGAAFRMRIFNADGSEAEMCGNGVRCFGEYLRSTSRAPVKFGIETLAGLIEVEFVVADERGGLYRVNMGPPKFSPADIPAIPVDINDTDFLMKEISALYKTFRVTAVSMGNPHAVVYTDEITDELVLTYGPAIQKCSHFPKGVNVEFAKVLSSNEIRMRVYERGCGETHACGTGACAAVVAGIAADKLENDVTVHLTGGDLKISWDGYWANPVYMTGPARIVFSGEI
ncbi:MAG: diaminopimelate epimerase [Chitinispirillia bacterium]|nr:diaminopimelate epimerase [Chitinispirillia bacterium]MCL2268842.1 diaminopimelate epimerase [Chitinispirillia bacterium]